MSGDDLFTSEEKDGAVIVTLNMSQIDMFNVTELLESFTTIIDTKPKAIVLNMEETSFIDSSGMGGLIRIHQQIKSEDGNLIITGLSPKVANLMRLTRSTRYLNCFDSMAEAMAHVAKIQV